MAYSSGGLIQASDFNGFAGGSAANVSGQLNCVLGTGNRDVGYGQTTVANVAQYSKIFASDWASLINKLNTIRQHQTGSGTGIGAPSTGNVIQYISTLGSSITNAYSSRLTYASSGATTTGTTYNTSFTAAGLSSGTVTITRTVTFASGDAARYFFNSGGKLTLVASGVNNNGQIRSDSIVTLLGTYFVSDGMQAITYTGRSGTGGSVTTNLTSGATAGYYGLTTNPTTTNVCVINPSGYYSSDSLTFKTSSNGPQGSNSDKGSVVYLTLTLFSQSVTAPLDVTVSTRVDVTAPETTYLSNSWGTITVS